MENLRGWIKEHPYIAGAFAVGVIVLFVIIRRNSAANAANDGSTAVYSSSPSAAEVQAASQLQVAQLQSQQAANQTAAAANVQSQQIAGQVTVAQLQAQTQQTSDALSAQVAEQIAALQATTSQTVSTLQAQVADVQSNNSVAINASNNATILGVAALPYTNITYADAQTLQNEIYGNDAAINTQGQNIAQLQTQASTFATKQQVLNTVGGFDLGNRVGNQARAAYLASAPLGGGLT